MKNLLVKKYYFVIVLFLLLILFFSYIGTKLFLAHDDEIRLKGDLTVDFLEKVKVSSFVAKVKGELVLDYYVDTSEVGKREVFVLYKNRYGIKVKKKFEIMVMDVTAPIISVQNPYVVEVGKIDNLVNTIFCADDYDDGIECQILGDYDLNQVGNYELVISAKDYSGNETSKSFTLKVVEKQKESKKTEEESGKVSFTSFKEVYKKYKTEDTVLGIDISKWQGDVDFKKIKEAGASFVILKLGGQYDMNSEMVIDPKFYENYEKASLEGLKIGVYFFSHAKEVKEARSQANWVLKKLGSKKIDLPIAFDWENWSNFTEYKIGFHTLNKIALEFISEIEDKGYQGMLYSSKYYLENIWYEEEYQKWLAYYSNEEVLGDYLFWQLCSDGKIDGIDGFVDIDVGYFS